MISFENVRKEYPSDTSPVVALDNINLQVKRGEIYGVIGYSGAGKSTLLRCINLLEQPTTGKVLVDGIDLTTLSSKELQKAKKNIGMIFQHFNLLNSKTVFDNVAMPLYLSNVKKSEIKKRVTELLEFVGLEDKIDRYPDQLSGGQKQRVGIARALATQPSILLCDEATSALDPQTTDSILQLLKRINEEYHISIVLITHEMSVIRDICDKVAVMDGGKIIEAGSVFDIFSKPQTTTARNFVSSIMNDRLPDSIRKMIDRRGDNHGIYRITFIGESAGQPFLSQVAKRFKVDVNVLFGNITELQGTPFGNIIVELKGEPSEVKRALFYIQQEQIGIQEVTSHAS